MSSGGSSVKNTIDSEGSFRFTSSDLALEDVASSSVQASQDGSSGSFCTVSSGQKNEFEVALWHSKEGDIDLSLSSLATPQEAMTIGSASALGTPCFSDELVQGIRGQDMAVSVQGLYLASENELGEFGVVAQNAKPGVAAPKPTPTTGGYKLLGYKWPTDVLVAGIPVTLYRQSEPVNGPGDSIISLDNAFSQISNAQGTWQGVYGPSSSKQLFDDFEYTDTRSSWDSANGLNTHEWTSSTGLMDSTIAMTTIWYNRATRNLVESDCWYNNRFTWRIDSVGTGKEDSVDIQTISLHELGHTLGLADLYQGRYAGQTMYGYNDGTADWKLGSGDIAGIKALYGT